MITESSIVDQITVNADGFVGVRRSNIVLKDGVEISRTYHRHVLFPGQDLTKEDSAVQKTAATAWTEEILKKYQQQKESANI